MKRFLGPFGLMAALALTACGSSSQTAQVANTTTPGSLALDPPFRIASADAATFAAQVGATASGAQLLKLTGAPTCGVDFYYLKFWTVGGAKETTQSSGALMVPTGRGRCARPRPIVLYAHWTETNQAINSV